MLRCVLVPLDGSGFAESALPTAIAVANRVGGALHLVSVLDAPATVLPAYAAEERQRTEAYLDSVVERVRSSWPGPVSASVREGWVVPELRAAAAEWPADLVVMSSHGRSGLSRVWMGSIAEQCLRAGFCPVLLVHPGEEHPAAPFALPSACRVVLPLDGSQHAERALPYGVALARAFGAPLMLLRALDHPRGAELSLPEAIEVVYELREGDRAEAEEYLNGRVATLRKAGLHAYGKLVDELGPAEAILAREEGDWVVITTCGEGGFERTLFGSVADKVVRASRHPLLVVPLGAEECEEEAPRARPTSP